MAAPKISSMDTRQKVTMAVFAIIVLVLLYMVYGMLKGEGETPPPSEAPFGSTKAAGAAPGPQLPPPPKQAELAKEPAPLSPQEAQMMQMQQAAEMRYVNAINELQMLRIQRDIAETNKAIIAARLDTVTAQKSIVNLLKPPVQITPATYQQGLLAPTGAAQGPIQPPVGAIKPPMEPTEVGYTVISVSLLKSRWGAVLGYQGNLYSVHVGDVLPVDGSKVINIDSNGLILEKNGIIRKLSMVPII